jgi:hypothetical protein
MRGMRAFLKKRTNEKHHILNTPSPKIISLLEPPLFLQQTTNTLSSLSWIKKMLMLMRRCVD